MKTSSVYIPLSKSLYTIHSSLFTHLPILPSTHPSIPLSYPFTNPTTIHASIPLSTHSPTQPSIPSPTHALTQLLIHPSIHPLTHSSSPYLSVHLLIHLSIHSFNHPPTHPVLTGSLTCARFSDRCQVRLDKTNTSSAYMGQPICAGDNSEANRLNTRLLQTAICLCIKCPQGLVKVMRLRRCLSPADQI